MGKSQWYIGSPNGVVLCVDHASRWQIRGRLYHAYSREGLKIANMEQLLFELEHFYDSFAEGKADAALAASLFHFKELEIREVKKYLRDQGISVRL